MTIAHSTSTVVSADVALFVRSFGTNGKLPVLVLHGANYFDSADWVDFAERMAGERPVAAFDARGFGNSGWSSEGYYGHATILSDIENVLKYLGWERAIVLGHSRGGAHALLAASHMHDRVAGLVLVDYNPMLGFGPPGGRPPPASGSAMIFPTLEAALDTMSRYKTLPLPAYMRERALQFLESVNGGFVVAKRDPAFLNPASSPAAEAEWPNLAKDGTEALAKIVCPTLVVRATRSAIFKPENIGQLGSRPGLQFVEIDSGHDVASEAPEALAAALAEWLLQTEAPACA